MVLIVLVTDTSIKLRVKYYHLSSMNATTPNLDRHGSKITRRWPHHFCAACFAKSAKNNSAKLAIFSTKNLFKETTCLIGPLYIGPQDGHIRNVLLYKKKPRKGEHVMIPGHRSLHNTCDMCNGNNINNRSTRPNYVYNGEEEKSHSCIYQTIINTHITS